MRVQGKVMKLDAADASCALEYPVSGSESNIGVDFQVDFRVCKCSIETLPGLGSMF